MASLFTEPGAAALVFHCLAAASIFPAPLRPDVSRQVSKELSSLSAEAGELQRAAAVKKERGRKKRRRRARSFRSLMMI